MFIDGLNIELTKKQQKFDLYQTAIDKLYINLEKEILDMYIMLMINGTSEFVIRPEVYASLYSSNIELYELTKDIYTPQTTQTIDGEKYIYIRLIQAFEDYLQYHKMWDISDPVWLALFIQWGQSKYLQEHFAQYKSNYNQTSIRFTELIFEYSRDIQVPNVDPEVYINKGIKLYSDERLTKIVDLAKNE